MTPQDNEGQEPRAGEPQSDEPQSGPQASDASGETGTGRQDAEWQAQQAAHDAYKRQHDERAWAMLAHLSVFAATFIPFGHIFGPLIVWLIKKDEYPLVDDQGKESLNFQISMSIYTIILIVVLVAAALGLAAGDSDSDVVISIIAAGAGLLIIGLLAFIFVIIASIKSYQGERYRYPLTIRFIS